MGKAVLAATLLMNRLPRVLDFKSHTEIFKIFFSDFNTLCNLILKVFNCIAYVHVHAQNKEKHEPLKQVFNYSQRHSDHPQPRKLCVGGYHICQNRIFSILYLQGKTIFKELRTETCVLLSFLRNLSRLQPNTVSQTR